MIARLLGSGPGLVKQTAWVPVTGVELVPGREIFGVLQPVIPALVRVLAVFATLAPGTPPTLTLAQSWGLPRLLVREALAPKV